MGNLVDEGAMVCKLGHGVGNVEGMTVGIVVGYSMVARSNVV